MDIETTQVGTPNDYTYNGKEFNEGFDDYKLDLYDYGARWYDASIAQFTTQDRFSEKYYDLSPYQYVGGNPINRIDVNGDSIDVSQAQQFDLDNNTNYLNKVVTDLQNQSGLSLYVENGLLLYKKDEEGNPIVGKDKDGNDVGSTTSRSILKGAIGKTKTALFSLVKEGGSSGDELAFQLDVNETESFMKGVSAGLNENTMGFGLMFTHELLHTDVGFGIAHGREAYIFGETGRIVNTVNAIRAQLGEDYGRRSSYISFRVNGKNWIPFDADNANLLSRQIIARKNGETNLFTSYLSPLTGQFIGF